MGRLQNTVAIVTGASGDIGRSTAKLFAAEGAKLVVGARRDAELAGLVAEIEAADGKAVALAGDVRSEAYAKALVALAVEKFGRLDIAFNNAGTLGEAGPSTNVSEAGWNDAIAINLTGSFLGAKHQIAEMLKHGGGSVIFTSTFVGYSFAFPSAAAYAASKSGLIGLTQALAAEFGPRGVRVNAILPGAVETGMYREMNDTADKQAWMTNLHALKRVAQPEEVARSGAIPSLRRLFVRHRHCLIGRRRRLYHPGLSSYSQTIRVVSGAACSPELILLLAAVRGPPNPRVLPRIDQTQPSRSATHPRGGAALCRSIACRTRSGTPTLAPGRLDKAKAPG